MTLEMVSNFLADVRGDVKHFKSADISEMKGPQQNITKALKLLIKANNGQCVIDNWSIKLYTCGRSTGHAVFTATRLCGSGNGICVINVDGCDIPGTEVLIGDTASSANVIRFSPREIVVYGKMPDTRDVLVDAIHDALIDENCSISSEIYLRTMMGNTIKVGELT